ncbi:hypothetical protein Tco_1392976 [Tanacetum coccineum]
MRQRTWWSRTVKCYDCELLLPPRMANVVADALSRKNRPKPLRVRALVRVLNSAILQEAFGTQLDIDDVQSPPQKQVLKSDQRDYPTLEDNALTQEHV